LRKENIYKWSRHHAAETQTVGRYSTAKRDVYNTGTSEILIQLFKENKKL